MERNRINEKSSQRRKPSGAAVKKESVTKAIEQALFQEWAATGYAAISIESVAKRAGVGKAAIYRRWPSKLAMVTDLVNKVGVDLIVVPNSGDLHCDIYQILLQLRRLLRHTLIARILPDLHAEMGRTPELAAGIRSTVQVQRRASAEQVLLNAINRKEIRENVDIDMALDMLGSMVYWRMIITKRRADRAYLEKLASLIVRTLKD
ncbi:TetR/AcrR family transcriptional regulator [Photobacterium sp. OFAV2-7]|uniref:TetR/AcrR family transcriptional regulator n=1 Tax=Photobacterium sp. OFAV2-7 TaxID=2917748 RepID=UPI001EF5F9A1|nr:TetR/AcrR family transcriptional regulator [Photobacterium sp. OFAV2-7]MCG7588213.1 TetR/AcrR family transcriptional regulator [Photobacterium sp. OFAV2-7]